MLHKVKGVVLNTINYNDKYILVQMFTDTFGRTTYMVAKSKRAKVPRSLFSLLSLLDMEVEHQASRDIQRIKEIRPLLYYHSISTDMKKTSMAFFLSEFLTRILRDNNDGQLIFDYLSQTINILEMTDKSIANFHLVFMLKLSRFLGFYPNMENYRQGALFDMVNGEFVYKQPLHRHFLNQSDSLALSRLERITFENMYHFAFSQQERITIINRILEYYRLHLYDFPQLKSLDVLHQLF